MITAKEALEAVRNRKKIDFSSKSNRGLMEEVNHLIVSHVNSGWLCLNLALRFSDIEDIAFIRNNVKKFGYFVDENSIMYWMYDMNCKHEQKPTKRRTNDKR